MMGDCSTYSLYAFNDFESETIPRWIEKCIFNNFE